MTDSASSDSRSSERSFGLWVSRAILLLAIVLLALQLRSLFVFPTPNAIRWYGDETWLMSEAKVQITTGVVRYPLAVGSTLEHSKGIVLGMPWLSAVLYGLPAAVLSSADIVDVGRVVTAVLAALLLGLIYVVARRFGSSQLFSSFAVLLLVSTRSFFFTSHSARTDLLAGLIVLAFVAFAEKERHREGQRSNRWWAFYGSMVAFLAISSSIHLLTLLVPVAVYYAYELGAFRSLSRLCACIGGGILTLGALITIYAFTTGGVSLFSAATGHVQFNDVVRTIPALRPFSRSVQVANVVIRLREFREEALPFVLLPFPAIACIAFGRWKREWRSLAIATAVVFFSWLQFEGAERTYLLHILPLLALWVAILASELKGSAVSLIVGVLSITLFYFGIQDAFTGLKAGSEIDVSNAKAVSAIEQQIHTDVRSDFRPTIVSETPSLERLSREPSVRTISDHFISFPERTETYDSFFGREHVNYVILYNSQAYPKIRAVQDTFYRAVQHAGTLEGTFIGMSGDMGRDYFNLDRFPDTLLLYKIR